MKRSEINRLIEQAIAFFDQHHFKLPPWAYWSPQQWAAAGPQAEEVRRHRLGWDLTDFGSGSFERLGLLLFTVRNGKLEAGMPTTPKTYAEKAMIVQPGQVTPWHFHWSKTEDIIVRGGGRLVIELAWATSDEAGLDDREVAVQCDGLSRTVPARGKVVLGPGESITLTPRLYHKFYGQVGDPPVFVGEVSSVNDDSTDNRFLEPVGRFPAIEPDEAPRHLLCTEYPD